MGGLASDSDEPMPTEMQGYLQSAWQKVAATTGAKFNPHISVVRFAG